MPWRRLPPTGEQLTISHGRQRLTVVAAGGGIRSYSAGGVDLLDGYAEDEPPAGGRGALLQPWPNRVRDGRFRFGGAEHQLVLTDPAHHAAIHGFARQLAFHPVHHHASSVTVRSLLLAQTGWPWPLQLEATYTLGDDGLTATVGATNVGTEPAPYGHGAHPYLRPGPGPCDTWTLQLPAATRLVYDDQLVPVGEEPVAGTALDFRDARTIGSAVIDQAFGDLVPSADGRVQATVADPAAGVALTLWADAGHRWLVAFTGDTLAERARHGVAIEPMTCPPNALVSGRDLVVLDPGASHQTTWGISVEGIDLV